MFEARPFPNKTLSWWFQERENIDFEPAYQRRGGLWSTEDKAYLIDSILNDFDIPKIYLADFTLLNTPLNEKDKRYAIIDGRQRFESIFDFFESRLTLKKDFVYFQDKTLELGGLAYKDLRQNYPRIASKFENFNLSVVSIFTDEEAKIKELFVRLNRSKPLTGAEIRNAMRGPIPEFIRRISQHPFFESRVKFQKKRGADLNVSGKLLLTEFRGKLVDTKKVQLDNFVEKEIVSTTDSLTRAARHVDDMLNRMIEIFVERDPLLGSQGPLTVYYWLIRSLDETSHGKVRPFLVEFEAARRQNREMARANPPELDQLDQQLVLYDAWNRSTNDQGSLEARFNILHERFERYESGA